MSTDEIKVEQLGNFPGCMFTFTGKLVDLFVPKIEDICIEDIAHGLANTSRWNGQTKKFFSVAQHSVMMHDLAPDKLALAFLLHDGEEAYWGDIIKPLKTVLKQACPDIPIKMNALRSLIYIRFGVQEVDYEDLDKFCLHYEYEHVFKRCEHACWTPEIAEQAFLNRFYSHFKI
jgi:hypothetical protein